MTAAWFEASKEGLAKIVADRPKVFVIHELLSNAYDTGCSSVDITLEKLPGRPMAKLRVVDDHPEGFKNLTHAWTLFAESERKDDPESSGRYCAGEKLVLALCEEAEIITTSGAVIFDKKGRRKTRQTTALGGSRFEATLRMTRVEFDQVLVDVEKVLFRPKVKVTFNGKRMWGRDSIGHIKATLPTVIGDEEGRLRTSRRNCQLDIYEPRFGEEAMLYELGIPVVATGDTYHVNILQKVPLNMDRDNVTPGFLKQVRGHVLNAMASRITEENATENWVTEAMGSKTVEKEALKKAVVKRFGKKAAAFDMSDREANGTLMTRGYNIVRTASLPPDARANVKAAGALLPSGQIAPTPKPFSDDPDADPADVMPPEKWTRAMREVACFAQDLHRELYFCNLKVQFITNDNRFAAAYGGEDCGVGSLSFFTKRLGKAWFETVNHEALVDLLVHEFAHRNGYDHNEAAYHEACTQLAGRVSVITYRMPELFNFLHQGDRYAEHV